MDFINYDTNTHQYIPTIGSGGYDERKLREIRKNKR